MKHLFPRCLSTITLHHSGWRQVGFCLTVLLSVLSVQAQERPPALFQEDAAARTAATGSRLAEAVKHSRPLTLALTDLRTALATAPPEGRANAAPLVLALPLPDGSSGRFRVVESSVMAPGLAAQFPSIKTYSGTGLDDPTATIRLDLTPKGFHAQVLSATGGTSYIDPISATDQTHYLSFYHRDMPAGLMNCGVSAPGLSTTTAASGNALRQAGTSLRTFRLAVAATGEYTAFQGGTVALAQAAIVTAVNRVVGIYERELAVRLVLVAGNASVVYDNAGTDPYNNGDPLALLSQNQANLDAAIGSGNYDIGHVFSTGGGGLALEGAVCQDLYKAQGETGLPNPVGDAFYVDYVAHEMGHQFGGSHTFNSPNFNCAGNANAATAFEPGSGSTIMAYAGICAPDDLQNNSDAYFHVASYEEILTYLGLPYVTCGTLAATGNTVPAIGPLPVNGKLIPISTPFKLTATATDADGDALTYCWEEADLGPNLALTDAQVANQTPPLFRSFTPAASPTRYFPRLPDIVANVSTLSEQLPTVTRNLSFRVTVRDAHNGTQGVVGGLNSSTAVTMSATSAAGPFLVLVPNTAVTWMGNTTQTVTWDVAGTTANGVNCANVNLLLSTDGGFTYSTVLLANTPNDGSQPITVPNLATTTARVMVEAADNHFFDISNTNFTITAALPVELVAFTAAPHNGAVQLSWRTASEKNSARFEVERSTDGRDFARIGTVAAQGTKASATDYALLDTSPPIRQSTIYYRLHQVDLDGTAAYSPVRAVQLAEKATSLALFPNPTASATTLTGALPGATVRVFDTLGRMVLTAEADATGSALLRWPAHPLLAGVYLVRAGQASVRLSIAP